MPRRSLFTLGLTALACFTSVACSGLDSSNNTTGFTPVTGIIVRGDALVRDFGCGTRAGQVFQYEATVFDADKKQPVLPRRYDCYADAKLSNLQPSASQSLDFNLFLYAFDAGGARAVDQAPGNQDVFRRNVGWATSCTATQQLSVDVLAVCKPLARVSRVILDPATLMTRDATGLLVPLQCGVDFKAMELTLVHRTRLITEVGRATCPATGVITGVLPNETYRSSPGGEDGSISLTLEKPAGGLALTGKCRLTTLAGADSPVVCDPF